jgi:hypothetical protein
MVKARHARIVPRRRDEPRAPALPNDAEVVVRPARPSDAGGLERIAQLDGRRAPAGPAIVAEVDGELLAAAPLDGGPPVANPYRPTAGVLRLLELRAAQLAGGPVAGYASRLRWRSRAARTAVTSAGEL